MVVPSILRCPPNWDIRPDTSSFFLKSFAMSKIRFELSLLTVVCSPKYSVSDFSKSSIYHHIYTSFKRPPRSSAKERTPWKPIYTLSSRPRGTILVLDASPFDSLVGRDSFASENYWINPHPTKNEYEDCATTNRGSSTRHNTDAVEVKDDEQSKNCWVRRAF